MSVHKGVLFTYINANLKCNSEWFYLTSLYNYLYTNCILIIRQADQDTGVTETCWCRSTTCNSTYLKIDNSLFERAKHFKHLGTPLTNESSIQE